MVILQTGSDQWHFYGWEESACLAVLATFKNKMALWYLLCVKGAFLDLGEKKSCETVVLSQLFAIRRQVQINGTSMVERRYHVLRCYPHSKTKSLLDVCYALKVLCSIQETNLLRQWHCFSLLQFCRQVQINGTSMVERRYHVLRCYPYSKTKWLLDVCYALKVLCSIQEKNLLRQWHCFSLLQFCRQVQINGTSMVERRYHVLRCYPYSKTKWLLDVCYVLKMLCLI